MRAGNRPREKSVEFLAPKSVRLRAAMHCIKASSIVLH